MRRKIQAGSTSFTDTVFVRNTSTTTSVAGLTGLVYNTGSMTLYYRRQGANASVAVSLVTATLGTWSSGGFIVVDGTNMPGRYEIGIPNAAIAGGAAYVDFQLRGATNMEEVSWTYELDAVNYQDGVHFGLTALPNTACTTNASLLTSGTGTDQVSVSAGKVLLQATQTGVTIPTVTTLTNGVTVTTNNDKTGYSLTQSFPANFSSLAITAGGIAQADVQTIKTQTVTCAAGVTVGPYVGNASAALQVDGSGYAKVSSGTGANQISLSSGTVTVGTNSDKTGYSLTQAFPTNFSSFAITAGGAVTVGTNNDKTGYTASTVTDKTGYSLTQSFPTNFSSMAITAGGVVTANTTQFSAQAITCAAPVTVGAYVGNANALLTVDASGRVDLGKIKGTNSVGNAGYIAIDGTQSPSVRNQDAVTAPTYDDCMVGAWCEAFDKEPTFNSTTWIKQKPDNSGPIRTFSITVDGSGNVIARS